MRLISLAWDKAAKITEIAATFLLTKVHYCVCRQFCRLEDLSAVSLQYEFRLFFLFLICN